MTTTDLDHRWDDLLDRVVTGDAVEPVFQPIVDLCRRVVVGYESLARFPIPGPDGVPAGPEQWFHAAAALGRTTELDAASVRAALARRADLPRNCFLTVNIEPTSLLEPLVVDVLRDAAPLSGLVLELTEHRSYDLEAVAPVVDLLRRDGARFAMDDAGSGYSGLQQLLGLRPSFLKLDRSLVQDIDRDETKRALVEMLGLFCNRIDAWLIAEGIETAAEARTLRRLDVPLVQGFFFARPQPTWTGLEAESCSDPSLLDVSSRRTLHDIVDPCPPTIEGDPPPLATMTRDDPWVAVVDRDRRPRGLLDPDTALLGEIVPTLVANVDTAPDELAARIVNSPHQRTPRPCIITDSGGHYLGLVQVNRLLAAVLDAPSRSHAG